MFLKEPPRILRNLVYIIYSPYDLIGLVMRYIRHYRYLRGVGAIPKPSNR